MRMLFKYGSVLLVVLSIWSSCTKDIPDPNGMGEEELLKTPEGMARLIVGIKQRFAVNSNLGTGSLFNAITANGFTTNEIQLKAGGNQNYGQLSSGGNNLATSNTVLWELWSNIYLINKYCSDILDRIPSVQDPAMAVNLKKYASLYKALSLGMAAGYWSKVPIRTGEDVPFVDGEEALAKAALLLDDASALPDLPPPADQIPVFGTEINLKQTLLALSARYHLMLGHYDIAIARAAAVDLKIRSVFFFNSQNPNPLFRSGFTSVFGYTVRPHFGLSDSLLPVRADSLREKFYTAGSPFTGFGFGKSDNDMIPIYLPGEMLLIQAEAHTRKNDLANGKNFLDLVLTKNPAQDAFGIGASLPAYSGPMDANALLLQIYKNRCIELFLSGLKLPDSRRFDRPGPGTAKPERNRDYYPYPLQERYQNPNTPPDPPY